MLNAEPGLIQLNGSRYLPIGNLSLPCHFRLFENLEDAALSQTVFGAQFVTRGTRSMLANNLSHNFGVQTAGESVWGSDTCLLNFPAFFRQI